MRQSRSIRSRLGSVFIWFFLLVAVLGLFSFESLSSLNKVSADIRNVWLPNTRVLGDLNNFTSDFRAAEGRYLLSSTAAELADTETEMAQLDQSIAQAGASYERIPNDAVQVDLYAQFTASWNQYRNIVRQIVELTRADRRADAIAMYLATSQAPYNAASEALGRLTDRNVAEAQQASARAESAYWQACWLILVAVLFAAAMVFAALLYVRRSITAPLLQLAGGMHRLAGNETDIDIHGTGRRDEIGEMARAVVVFRRNAIELMLSQRGLAQQASMLEEKLAHEQGLALLQRNFLSMASHEFRTPLTIIDFHAQRLVKMNGRLSSNEIAERAGKVRGAVLRMTSLIDNLLNSSRLVDGGAELYFHPAEIDLAALLRDVTHLHRETAPGSQILASFDAPLRAVGDAKLLFQTFSNLLSNAVKYSAAGAPVRISAAIESNQIVVAVEDQGIGIPEKDRGRLFGRYYRGSNVSGIVGTGVGLYLVKMVLDLHGGSIEVDSKEGAGSRFTVRLPINPPAKSDPRCQSAAPAASADAARIAEQHIGAK
jgi:two-component system, OmpR family, sensor kinase